MSPKSIILFFILSVSTTLAQISPAFFGSFPPSFSSPFGSFGSFGSVGSSGSSGSDGGSSIPTPGNGRENTGPILFPPAPESRDTSGVIVGASGYGFVPPGGSQVVQGRDLPPPSFSGSFGADFRNPFFHL